MSLFSVLFNTKPISDTMKAFHKQNDLLLIMMKIIDIVSDSNYVVIYKRALKNPLSWLISFRIPILWYKYLRTVLNLFTSTSIIQSINLTETDLDAYQNLVLSYFNTIYYNISATFYHRFIVNNWVIVNIVLLKIVF